MNHVARKTGRFRTRAAALAAWLGAAACLALSAPAQAQTPPAAQARASYTFDIDAQALSTALEQLGLQSGVQISTRSELVEGLRTAGVSGELPLEDALHLLLAGSDLTFRINGDSVSIQAQAPSSGVHELRPLVVVGEKVERSYRETFTSVGVATGEDVDTYKMDDLHDTFDALANVRYFPSNKGNNGMQIRGVNADGITEPENSAPQISVVIDGVVQSSEALRRGSRGTWDVKQIEVLRGPQSTLQGRNALAGAVVVETNDPSFDPEGAVRGTLGSLDRHDGAFMISGPIIEDQVAFRLSGELRDQKKDIAVANPADEPQTDDEYRTIRGKLLIEPLSLPDLNVLLTANDVFDQPSFLPASDPDFFDRIYDSNVNGYSAAELRKISTNNYSLDVSYHLNERMTVHSVTSFHDADLSIASAPGNTLYARTGGRENNDLTQDLRLEFGGDASLTGTLGLFYGDFDSDISTDFFIASAILFGAGDHTIESTARNKTHTKAVYADLRYRLNDRISLLGGLRYQMDEVSNFIDTDVTGALENSTLDLLYDKSMDETVKYNVLLPKFGVAYDFSQDRTIAATISRGYRQGFSQVVEETQTQVKEIDPEFVWTTEIAYRDESIKGLRYGVNLFYNMYTDQQILVTENGQNFTSSAGKSVSYGAEIEGRYAFGDGWQAYGALGLLQTEIKDLTSFVCTGPGGTCDGNEFPESPAVTASLGAVYKHPSGWFGAMNANYTSQYYSNASIDNKDIQLVDGYFLANARAGYKYGYFKASVYVDNIFDNDYLTSISSDGIEANVGDGRTFGVQLEARF